MSALTARAQSLAVFDSATWHVINRDRHAIAGVLGLVFSESDEHQKHHKALIVTLIAMTMRSHGRGGALALVTPGSLNGLIMPPSTPVSALPAGRDAIGAPASPSEQFFVEVVAAGAGMDGVTVIEDTHLRVLGFGAKIDAPYGATDVSVFEFPNMTPEVVPVGSLGGMRHQSAARLAAANHPATIITVSQDGAISIIAWAEHEATVVVAKHIERYLLAIPPRHRGQR